MKAKESKTRRDPFAVRVSGKVLADYIRPPSECAKMLERLAKSKAGLPNMATRANSRMVVLLVNGKPARINPNFIGGLFGLVHHSWVPYMSDAKGKVNKAKIKAQADAAKEGRLYHYRTLLLQLAKAGYTVKLSADCDDDYVAGGLKAAVKASKEAKAGTK